MLQVDELKVSYGKVDAVRGVSLIVPPKEVTLVLGANGAGKTTTLRAISGLVPYRGGTITLDGQSVKGVPAHGMVRRGLVMVPEGRRVFAPLTVRENLLAGAHTRKGPEVAGLLERVYSMFPILFDRREGKAGLLSGGEQQMLAFGRALMAQPKVMLLDEPSMGLAPAIIEVVFQAVRNIADDGMAVLMVEQNADAALAVADTVLVIDRGEVVFGGSAHEARTNASIVRAFLGDEALT